MATLSASEKTSKLSRLLGLPAEVKNMIYRYVVVHNKPISPCRPKIVTLTYPYEEDVSWEELISVCLQEPALAATSQEIRSEALTIFYSENTFNVTRLYDCVCVDFVELLLRDPGEERLDKVRHVVYCSNADDEIHLHLKPRGGLEINLTGADSYACSCVQSAQKYYATAGKIKGRQLFAIFDDVSSSSDSGHTKRVCVTCGLAKGKARDMDVYDAVVSKLLGAI